jgi:DNA-binding response OmpR family regulator
MAVSHTLLHAEKILVTDDDLMMRRACVAVLVQAGYRVVEAGDGRECLDVLQRERPALIVMDLDMPGLNGLEAIKRMRADGDQTPVIMLTGFNEVEHRVRGLGVGADDFIGKPFHERELLARVGAVLRRSQPAAATRALVFGDVTVDPAGHTATARDGAAVPLTKKEFAILELLARTPGRPVARETILDAVWGYGQAANTRTLDTHIWRLRRKLGDNGEMPRWIRNVTGIGYELHSDPAPAPV